ncbi:MAG: hypothetical protein HKN68_17220 [Saprospiraceae bacterium]|nr:hypothetical protein [Saprospiraceae bacterium]
MVTTEVLQKIRLVDGQFTPSEASDVVSSLINEKINFHKIQRLGMFIHDEDEDAAELNGRVQELIDERKKAKAIIAEARAKGYNVKINGILEITFEK